MPNITRSAARTGGLLIGIAAVCLAIALALFSRALPTVALTGRMPRGEALRRADSVFAAKGLAPRSARRAVRFEADDSLLTFVDLAGGGRDTLAALVRGQDVAPYSWSVRAFTPQDPHEARVDFDPAGRVVGFERRFAEADVRPALSADSARRIAEGVLTTWLAEPLDRWRLATSSYETRKTSNRVDHTFTFERIGRTVAKAPIRLDVVIAGDLPAKARRYVVIPESFRTRYSEMRGANDLLEIIDTIAVFALLIAVVVVLRARSRDRAVRWQPAFVVGAIVAGLLVAGGLNDMPLAWFSYDTATSPLVFEAEQLIAAIAGGIAMGAIVALTLAAAEASARRAFPNHLDWWKLWESRGTREVAGRVLGGYTVAAIALAYVTVFYLITRSWFGWWVPTEMLDDPNQIATPFPWISGVALSLQAGVWEETLFRALPLSLLSFWVGNRPHRRWWMAGGVVATALVFGFAHSNYPSWPPYSRGIEIFIDATFWAVLVVEFGAIVTIIGHFLYDLTLFGLFAAAGSALQYRISALMIGLALLAPAIAVLWKRLAQQGFTTLPETARFGAWAPAPETPKEAPPPERPRVTLSRRTEAIVMVGAALALVAAIAAPADPVLGPRFTASKERVIAVADSMLTARGGAGDLSSWRRLTGIGTDTLPQWPRFLRANHAEYLAQALSSTYEVPTWWTVRYVHTGGQLASRIEEWRVRVLPDGKPLDLRHVVPDSAPGGAPSPDEERRIARTALAHEGLDTARLKETKLDVTARPLRRDATITYTDSSLALPAGAAAHVWVSLGGTEPLVVRRGIELPEAFLRSDRQTQETHVAIAAALGLLLFGALITGIILIIRGKPRLVEDALVGRRGLWILFLAGAATAIATALNNLPASLFNYDTAKTWNNFTSTVGVTVVFAAIAPLFFLGVWLVTTALRQRVGIPAGALDANEPPLRSTWLAGIGLGALFALVSLIPSAAVGDLPPAPHTLLDNAIPWLVGPVGVVLGVASALVMLPIPFLVIAGASPRTRVRVLIAVGVVLVAGGAAASVTTVAGHGVSTVGVVLSVAALVSFVVAIPVLGPVSVMAWVVAMLTLTGLSGIHEAVRQPTGPERLGSTLTVVVVAILLTVLLTRHARINRSRFGQAPGSH